MWKDFFNAVFCNLRQNIIILLIAAKHPLNGYIYQHTSYMMLDIITAPPQRCLVERQGGGGSGSGRCAELAAVKLSCPSDLPKVIELSLMFCSVVLLWVWIVAQVYFFTFNFQLLYLSAIKFCWSIFYKDAEVQVNRLTHKCFWKWVISNFLPSHLLSCHPLRIFSHIRIFSYIRINYISENFVPLFSHGIRRSYFTFWAWICPIYINWYVF